MKKKNKKTIKTILIIIGITSVLALISVFTFSITNPSTDNSIQVINADGTTIFRVGDGDKLKLDLQYVQLAINDKWNNAFIMDGKGDADHLYYLSGQALFIDNKLYSVEEGYPTEYGDTACGTFCSYCEGLNWQCGMGIDASNCGAFVLGCNKIFSQQYLLEKSLPSTLMTVEEKNNLTGCYDVTALAGIRHYEGNTGSTRIDMATEYSRKDTRICFETEPITTPPCPYTFAPVCAKTGQTFTNQCVMESQGQTLDCEKECPCVTPPTPVEPNWFEKIIDWIKGIFRGDS